MTRSRSSKTTWADDPMCLLISSLLAPPPAEASAHSRRRARCRTQKSWVSVAKLEGENCAAGSDGHHLLPAVQEGDRRGSNVPSGIHFPQLFAGFGIQGENVPFVASAKDQLARCGQDSSPGFGMQFVIPDLLPGLRIQGPHGPPAGILRQVDLRNAADISIARAIDRLAFSIESYILPGRKIEEPSP